MVADIATEFSNCLPALESMPSREMIQKALNMRKAKGLTEPMFRTLLKIRKEARRKG